MSHLKTHRIYNLSNFLIILLLFGCGYTPTVSGSKFEIINGNSTSLISNEFRLKKLDNTSDFDQLPKELTKYKGQIGQFDFYLAQSPTQNSGGYVFEVVETSNRLLVCLKKPDPQAGVSTVLTNPIALIKIRKGISIEMQTNYCIK
jgi:hypothetical protein